MNNECELYILSGLGADHKVFAKLQLPRNHHYLHWIEEKKNESLNAYAIRLCDQIKHDNIVLIGLSFGGIIAQEIAKIRAVKHIILLSSIRSANELAWYYRLAGRLGISYLLPNFIIKSNTVLLRYLFSLSSDEESALLNDILHRNSSKHFRWALNHIANWNEKVAPCPISQIHAKRDRIFRTKFLKSSFELVEGGHFMLYTDANQTSTALKNALEKIPDCTF